MADDTALVSIIMTVNNGDKYVKQALDSMFRQMIADMHRPQTGWSKESEMTFSFTSGRVSLGKLLGIGSR